MATYRELHNYLENSDLMAMCEVALLKAAETVKDAYGGAGQYDTKDARLWARHAVENRRSEAKKALAMVLMDNSSATTVQIDQVIATDNDTMVQNMVNGILPLLIQMRADQFATV